MKDIGSVKQRCFARDSRCTCSRPSLPVMAELMSCSAWESFSPSRSSVVPKARPRRTWRSFRVVTISSRAGATDSAAAVGVEHLLSATMSQIEVSGSCPIPVITGTGQAATARASPSSLNAMRSSKEPPPRTRRIASGFAAAAIFKALTMVLGASGPWTEAPTIWSSTSGVLRLSVLRTSSMTEPEREVTTATRVQKRGMGR